MPSNITNIWEPTRHYSFAKIPNHIKDKGFHICSFIPSDNTLMCAVSSEGSFLVFSIPEAGGECVLKREESVMDPEED